MLVEGLIVVGIHGTSSVGVVGNVVGTESHQGLEQGQQLLGEAIHTSAVVKDSDMANVRGNVCVLVNSERFLILKGVQF